MKTPLFNDSPIRDVSHVARAIAVAKMNIGLDCNGGDVLGEDENSELLLLFSTVQVTLFLMFRVEFK